MLDLTHRWPSGLCLVGDKIAAVGLKGRVLQLWDLLTGMKLREWKAHDSQNTVYEDRLF
jgi:hypothetical protein